MEEWKVILLTSGLSLASSVIVAIITGLITARSTRINDDRKLIHEKRIILYFKIQSRIESLIYDREQIYDIKYRNSVLKYRPHVALWASKEVREIYTQFYDYINGIFEDYIDFTWEPYPDDMVEDYRNEHLPNVEKIKGFRDSLCIVMQKDMGSNK